jgi:hypothetical protein
MQRDRQQTRQKSRGYLVAKASQKLHVPIPATPRLNHRGLAVCPGSTSGVIVDDSTVRASVPGRRVIRTVRLPSGWSAPACAADAGVDRAHCAGRGGTGRGAECRLPVVFELRGPRRHRRYRATRRRQSRATGCPHADAPIAPIGAMRFPATGRALASARSWSKQARRRISVRASALSGSVRLAVPNTRPSLPAVRRLVVRRAMFPGERVRATGTGANGNGGAWLSWPGSPTRRDLTQLQLRAIWVASRRASG